MLDFFRAARVGSTRVESRRGFNARSSGDNLMGSEEVRQFLFAWLGENTRFLIGDEALEMEITDDLNLVAGGVIDSLGFLNLLTALEERFGIEVDLSEVEPSEFSTPAGLIKAVVQSSERSDRQIS